MSINQSQHGLLSVRHETEENANSPTLPGALAEKLPETIVRAQFHQIGNASHTTNNYFHIFLLFFVNSLHIYTRGILRCLLGFWSLSQNPAGAIKHVLSFSFSVFLSFFILFLFFTCYTKPLESGRADSIRIRNRADCLKAARLFFAYPGLLCQCISVTYPRRTCEKILRAEHVARNALTTQDNEAQGLGNAYLVHTPIIVTSILLLIFFPGADLSHLDSQPGTPMSVESANSEASKVRLKIKVRFAACSFFYLVTIFCSMFLGLSLNRHLLNGFDNSYVFEQLSMVEFLPCLSFTQILWVDYLNEVYLKQRFNKSLDPQISTLVGYFMLFQSAPYAFIKLFTINGVQVKPLGKLKMAQNAVLLNIG